ncbi:uncharacterized protein CTRU02_215271 [Colletotrichum truncatum]|uniref:Uncharacterized protein n=1 Tax=Colletotrichum truncatum TaxID=5467 RepID=A0ACC3YDB4_COLTU
MESSHVDPPTRKILSRWDISNLHEILGSDRSPKQFSNHLRHSLAILAQETSLDQARSWLATEIETRQNDSYRNRGPPRNFLTHGDVKGVLQAHVISPLYPFQLLWCS